MNYIDIDHLTAQVPQLVGDDPVMVEIYTVQAAEINLFVTAIWTVLAEMFPATATNEGLMRFERQAQIAPFNFGEIQRRRAVIMGKMRTAASLTKAALQEIVEVYGYGTIEITERPEISRVEIVYADRLGLPPFIGDVEAEIIRKMPAHLEVVFIIRYLVWSALDGRNLTWDLLDAKEKIWDDFEVWEG